MKSLLLLASSTCSSAVLHSVCCVLLQVAGTQGGITAVQLDTKLPGVDLHILEAALRPAAAARRKILAAMEAAVKVYESSECTTRVWLGAWLADLRVCCVADHHAACQRLL